MSTVIWTHGPDPRPQSCFLFAGNEILGANNLDLKHFLFRTVLDSGEKTMCLMKDDREMMRNTSNQGMVPQGWGCS